MHETDIVPARRPPQLLDPPATRAALAARMTVWTRPSETMLRVWLWNARSLRHKTNWLMDTIEHAEVPDVIIVTETHLVADRPIPKLTGYGVWTVPGTAHGGGLAIYYREILTAFPIEHAHHDRILIGNVSGATIIAAYSPVETALLEEREEFYGALEARIAALPIEYRNAAIIAGGDYNAKVAGCYHRRDNKNGRLLKALTNRLGLVIHRQ
jgi:exonuclease III